MHKPPTPLQLPPWPGPSPVVSVVSGGHLVPPLALASPCNTLPDPSLANESGRKGWEARPCMPGLGPRIAPPPRPERWSPGPLLSLPSPPPSNRATPLPTPSYEEQTKMAAGPRAPPWWARRATLGPSKSKEGTPRDHASAPAPPGPAAGAALVGEARNTGPFKVGKERYTPHGPITPVPRVPLHEVPTRARPQGPPPSWVRPGTCSRAPARGPQWRCGCS
jgi:hypothetical protein